MADRALVEHLVQLGSVGAGASGAPPDRAARSGGQCGQRGQGAGGRGSTHDCHPDRSSGILRGPLPRHFERPLVDLPPLPIDRRLPRSLAGQLADGLRAAAIAGVLRPGDRLPSTRSLSAQLELSRTVCAAAYDQLLAEGWLATRRGSGTFVVGVPAPGAVIPSASRPVPASLLGPSTPRPVLSLRAGVPCLAVLDRGMWRRAWRDAADAPVERASDPEGLPPFRAAVVEHLLRHRGLPGDPALVL